jgi:hypothetical protein
MTRAHETHQTPRTLYNENKHYQINSQEMQLYANSMTRDINKSSFLGTGTAVCHAHCNFSKMRPALIKNLALFQTN